jgi:hypothetical protein
VIKNTPNGLHDVVVPPPVIDELLDPWSARRADAVEGQDNPLHAKLLEILGAILLTCLIIWWSRTSSDAPPPQPMRKSAEASVYHYPKAAPSRPQETKDSPGQLREEEPGRMLLFISLLSLYQQQFDWQRPSTPSDSINQPQQATPQYSQEYIDLLVSRRNELKTEAAELRKSLQEPVSLTSSVSAAKRDRLQLRQRMIERQIFAFDQIIVRHREIKGIEAQPTQSVGSSAAHP